MRNIFDQLIIMILNIRLSSWLIRGETPVISSMLCVPDVLEYAPPFILTICSEYNKSGKTTEYKPSGGVLWCVVEGEYSIPEHCKNWVPTPVSSCARALRKQGVRERVRRRSKAATQAQRFLDERAVETSLSNRGRYLIRAKHYWFNRSYRDLRVRGLEESGRPVAWVLGLDFSDLK